MQLWLDMNAPLPKGAYAYGPRSSGETHGLVLTKPHIVDLILDEAGYTADRGLHRLRLLEPACGEGAFLVPAVDRLMSAASRDGVPPSGLQRSIAAFDVDEGHIDETRKRLLQVLKQHRVHPSTAQKLVAAWVRLGDFLLAGPDGVFDVVVGNPPYIRIEQLPAMLQTEYRRRYKTVFDRADLYVAFIERGLSLLSPSGVLSFICADRWTLNKYGGPLRKFVTATFQVKTYVDLHRASPFESDVIAYPSIFAIGRAARPQPTIVARLSSGSAEECDGLRIKRADPAAVVPGVDVAKYETWFRGEDPWVLSSPEHLALLRQLESKFRLLEDGGGTEVRIGVATGCDRVLVVPHGVDIEPDRLLPLVMRSDIEDGKVVNGRRFVINTYHEKGGVIDLADFPRLARYLEANKEALAKRHVAKKGDKWFRTIDRVYPSLVTRPKLLIPDIAGANDVVFESGSYYPHHNLYFVVSDEWDMEVLGGLLSSRIALFFVWSYAVKMRGGYLRFQAQYLRRIRVPNPSSVPAALKRAIRSAFLARDFAKLDKLACSAYGMAEMPAFDFVDTRA